MDYAQFWPSRRIKPVNIRLGWEQNRRLHSGADESVFAWRKTAAAHTNLLGFR